MVRRNLALLCAGVLCFWRFALAFGTAEGRGVAVQVELPTAAPAAGEDVPVVDAAAQPQLSLICRAAILVDQDTGTVLYEKYADEQVPIASITRRRRTLSPISLAASTTSSARRSIGGWRRARIFPPARYFRSSMQNPGGFWGLALFSSVR